MDGDIVFYIHGDTIEYGGELFSTGELTADILNLSLKDYQCIHKNVQCMKDLAEQYERTQDREFWWKLNHQFVALRKRMMEFRVFQILLRDDSRFSTRPSSTPSSAPCCRKKIWTMRIFP